MQINYGKLRPAGSQKNYVWYRKAQVSSAVHQVFPASTRNRPGGKGEVNYLGRREILFSQKLLLLSLEIFWLLQKKQEGGFNMQNTAVLLSRMWILRSSTPFHFS